jgi:hypothetical protein
MISEKQESPKRRSMEQKLSFFWPLVTRRAEEDGLNIRSAVIGHAKAVALRKTVL